MRAFATLDDADIKNKRVLVRVDILQDVRFTPENGHR
jgi:hypothetical protein